MSRERGGHGGSKIEKKINRALRKKYEDRYRGSRQRQKPGPKPGPRLDTILKQVQTMNLKKGESVVINGLRFTKT